MGFLKDISARLILLGRIVIESLHQDILKTNLHIEQNGSVRGQEKRILLEKFTQRTKNYHLLGCIV